MTIANVSEAPSAKTPNLAVPEAEVPAGPPLWRLAVRVSSQPVRLIWKVIVAVVGLTVVGIGVLMIVLPGPAMVVIPAGLAILATEFLWARRLLTYIKKHASEAWQRATQRR